MCGIAGMLSRLPKESMEQDCVAMMNSIKHRGPDSIGIWSDLQVSLGNVRLAIVDPCERSNQPMKSEDGRYTLVYNGEIYNYIEIRELLTNEGVSFSTVSDTEVVLQSLIKWGVSAFEKFNGMWAIALWDSVEKILICSRDRFGKKPFFWTLDGEKFIFSSEIKSFLSIGLQINPSWQYLNSYVHNEGIDAGRTSPFKEVFSLTPGSMMKVRSSLQVTTETWWNGFTPNTRRKTKDSSEALFRRKFKNAVEIRLPVNQRFAISLSGGLDSTAVAAMTREIIDSGQSGIVQESVKCYTVNFGQSKINEIEAARDTAKRLGFDHQAVEIKLDKFRELVREITWHQESLVWGSAAISFQALYKAIAKDGNKVALEGHGSDEYLAGYPNYARYAMAHALSRMQIRDARLFYQLLKRSSNQAIGEGLQGNQLAGEMRYLMSVWLDRIYPQRRLIRNIEKLQGVFTESFTSEFIRNEKFKSRFTGLHAKLDAAVHFETLPQILRVFDRVSMAEGVESRMPFMDFRLMEIAFRAEKSEILNRTGLKALLRNSLSDIIPMHVLQQSRKQGFGGDENSWFRNKQVLDAFESIVSDGLIFDIPGINADKYSSAISKIKMGDRSPLVNKSVWLAFSYCIWYSLFVFGDHVNIESK
jgi:asparagine synthase (glutamine-hydrolysing)